LESNQKDNLIWKGDKTEVKNTVEIDTYKDHRMAMAFAPAALLGQDLIINDPMVITKSYPHYWEDLKMIGISQCDN